jgi:hypothetical protein
MPAYVSTVPVPGACLPTVRKTESERFGGLLPILSFSVVDPHWFRADPDPDTAFYLNADPDLGRPTNVDPDPGQTITKVEYFHEKCTSRL